MLGVDTADLFTYSWMRSVATAPRRTTVGALVAATRRATNLSHVVHYGDRAVAAAPIEAYFGAGDVP